MGWLFSFWQSILSYIDNTHGMNEFFVRGLHMCITTNKIVIVVGLDISIQWYMLEYLQHQIFNFNMYLSICVSLGSVINYGWKWYIQFKTHLLYFNSHSVRKIIYWWELKHFPPYFSLIQHSCISAHNFRLGCTDLSFNKNIYVLSKHSRKQHNRWNVLRYNLVSPLVRSCITMTYFQWEAFRNEKLSHV